LKVLVIGGGAAGFFAALSVKQHHPDAEVTILEKSTKFLAKVKISGGGRCNVCNATFNNRILAEKYPRGEKFLRQAFEQFNAKDTFDWFESRGVALKTYPDNCVFPVANDSQVIIDCFLREAKKTAINLITQQGVEKIEEWREGFRVYTKTDIFEADKLIITTGGHPKKSGFHWIENLGISIVDPVPSLFSFNIEDESLHQLMGNVIENASAKIEGQKLKGIGPILVTHWGLSGPAILQLSAWGARLLEAKNYNFNILVNWLGQQSEIELQSNFKQFILRGENKQIQNFCPFPFTNRFWIYLLHKLGIPLTLKWKELQGKYLNKLINGLINDVFVVTGKTTFKEEFVTAGGIQLSEIDYKTMESKQIKGIYFAGEIMDIDGITGGFNFQAAWTTGFIAGKLG
jgi:predicted Rossmann fold flavoprotein